MLDVVVANPNGQSVTRVGAIAFTFTATTTVVDENPVVGLILVACAASGLFLTRRRRSIQ